LPSIPFSVASPLGWECGASQLAWTSITDAGLVHLEGLAQLESLNLRETAIGNPAIKYIIRLPKLHSLNVSGTEINFSGVKGIANAMPQVDLRHGF